MLTIHSSLPRQAETRNKQMAYPVSEAEIRDGGGGAWQQLAKSWQPQSQPTSSCAQGVAKERELIMITRVPFIKATVSAEWKCDKTQVHLHRC